jgi:hypothetical protein
MPKPPAVRFGPANVYEKTGNERQKHQYPEGRIFISRDQNKNRIDNI